MFSCGWSEHPLAPVCYALSAYTLTAAVLWLVPRIPRWRRSIAAHLRGSKLYPEEKAQRRTLSMVRALAVGLLLVLYKTAAGLYYHNVWFVAMAFYHLVLSLQRGVLLAAQTGHPRQMHADRASAICGWLMLLLAVSVFGMWLLLFRDGDRIAYPGHMIYAAAFYAFYTLTMAIVHAVRGRARDGVLRLWRRVNLTAALVSIMILQAALLSAFSDDPAGAKYANLATGGAVAFFALVLGIYMIVCRSAEGTRETAE